MQTPVKFGSGGRASAGEYGNNEHWQDSSQYDNFQSQESNYKDNVNDLTNEGSVAGTHNNQQLSSNNRAAKKCLSDSEGTP